MCFYCEALIGNHNCVTANICYNTNIVAYLVSPEQAIQWTLEGPDPDQDGLRNDVELLYTNFGPFAKHRQTSLDHQPVNSIFVYLYLFIYDQTIHK